jgi:hypothetical protein
MSRASGLDLRLRVEPCSALQFLEDVRVGVERRRCVSGLGGDFDDGLALVDEERAEGVVATALELYEQKGNVAAAARVRAAAHEAPSST